MINLLQIVDSTARAANLSDANQVGIGQGCRDQKEKQQDEQDVIQRPCMYF